MEKINALDYTRLELREFLKAKGEKPYRADQIFSWLYKKREESLDSMTDLSQSFRQEAADFIFFQRPDVVDFKKSRDGTEKYLFDAGEARTVETVMIPSKGRKTLCVSSEVGCNLGCDFCYTGKFKLKKRLSPSEIVGQFLEVNDRHLQQDGVGLSNIVFMGMGEPLDNTDSVVRAIQILTSDHGLNLSKKRITVSTSGLIKEIPKVTGLGVKLAVSLNASNNEVRSQVMPINKKHNIQELLKATDEHSKETGDEVTFEYVMLKEVTDRIEHAKELVQLLRSKKAMINLIPFNEHPAAPYKKPSEKDVEAFQKYLLQKGLKVYRRQTRGDDIYAACGQLHAVKQKEANSGASS